MKVLHPFLGKKEFQMKALPRNFGLAIEIEDNHEIHLTNDHRHLLID